MQYVGAEFLDRVNYYSRIWWPARTLVERAHSTRFQVPVFAFTCFIICVAFWSVLLHVLLTLIGWLAIMSNR